MEETLSGAEMGLEERAPAQRQPKGMAQALPVLT